MSCALVNTFNLLKFNSHCPKIQTYTIEMSKLYMS